MNSIEKLRLIFWTMAQMCLKDIIQTNHDKWIRMMYPKDGAPDWTTEDDIVFLNLRQRDDDYGKQRDSVYLTDDATVKKRIMRTRVWDVEIAAYGKNAFKMVTALQDGVFSPDVKRILFRFGIALVPNMPIAQQSNEVYAGKWWERWNTTLTFNEEYVMVEDAGRIESVSVTAVAQK